MFWALRLALDCLAVARIEVLAKPSKNGAEPLPPPEMERMGRKQDSFVRLTTVTQRDANLQNVKGQGCLNGSARPAWADISHMTKVLLQPTVKLSGKFQILGQLAG